MMTNSKRSKSKVRRCRGSKWRIRITKRVRMRIINRRIRWRNKKNNRWLMSRNKSVKKYSLLHAR